MNRSESFGCDCGFSILASGSGELVQAMRSSHSDRGHEEVSLARAAIIRRRNEKRDQRLVEKRRREARKK